MSKKHISRIAEDIESLGEVTELGFSTLTICLHNNLLCSLASLSSFTQIVDLNVSLNRLASTDGLSGMSRLTSLNLSSNLLQQCQNLNGLSSLKSLQLQHNHIASLASLSDLPKFATRLAYLDLRGNIFSPVHERLSLNLLSGLATLLVDHGDAKLEAFNGGSSPWGMQEASAVTHVNNKKGTLEYDSLLLQLTKAVLAVLTLFISIPYVKLLLFWSNLAFSRLIALQVLPHFQGSLGRSNGIQLASKICGNFERYRINGQSQIQPGKVAPQISTVSTPHISHVLDACFLTCIR